MQVQETLIDIIKSIFKNKKIIIRNVVIATAVAVIMSLTMKNYYKSTSVFYPTSPDIMKPEFVFGKANKDMEFYGTALDLDRILTAGNSNELYNVLIDTLNLYQKYKIDSNAKNAKFKVIRKFKSFYNLEKTKLDAVELSVEDTDPKEAAKMANVTTSAINDIVSNMIKKSLVELAATLNSNIADKQRSIFSLADSLSILRKKYNIIDPKNQAEMMLSSLMSVESRLARDKAKLEHYRKSPGSKRDSIANLAAVVSGFEKLYAEMTDSTGTSPLSIKKFNDGRNQVEIMDTKLVVLKDNLALDQARYEEILSVLKSRSNALSIVEQAEEPQIKSRPKRSLIVLGVMALTFLFSVLGIIVIETFKNPEWKRLWNE